MNFKIARIPTAGLAILAAALAAPFAPIASAADGNSADTAAGKQLFEDWGCASCHALKDAGATGLVGPSLDGSKLSRDETLSRIKNGQGAMPSFSGLMTDEEIETITNYIVAVRAE